MASRVPVFYSFHHANDVFRVQLVRNIGMISDNSPASANEWVGICMKGPNPFEQFRVEGDSMADLVQCYDPGGIFTDAYEDISSNLESWVETAIEEATCRR